MSHTFEEKFQLIFARKMMQFRLEVKQTLKIGEKFDILFFWKTIRKFMK